MRARTYFTIAATFFLADVIFHVLRVFVSWTMGIDMELPLWVSYGAILWSGLLAWQGFRLMKEHK